MKPAGNIIRIDNLGRVLIPKNIRMQFDLKPGDCLEVFIDNGDLVLRKYLPRCVFCDKTDDTIAYMDKHVCRSCADKLSKTPENQID